MNYYSIPAFFNDSVERNPGKPWLLAEDEEFTYKEAFDRVGAMAGVLAERGVGHGTLVLATTRNEPRYLFVWLATMHLGAILVPVNPRSTHAELKGFCDQVDPYVIVTDANLAEAFSGQRPAGGILDVEDASRAAITGDHPEMRARESDPAVLIPTSGTTGRSKLVTQTHRAYTMAGEGFPHWMQLGSQDRLMTSLPLFHINCPAYTVMGSIGAGASVALLPRFSASSFLDDARRHKATEFNAIGAMLEILMNQSERDDDADNPLRLCYTGPSPAKDRQLEIEERFGIEIVCGYGLSESTYGFVWPHGERLYGTLGKPRQHPYAGRVNEARVSSDGEVLPAGEVGELELRNPAVMLGYWGMPEETAEAFTEDGWLRTGDLVVRDDNDVYTFIGRQKEVIRRRGENLSPTEVESALIEARDVKEAAVIGIPSELTEEEVKAFVVPAAGAQCDPAEVRELASSRLSAFKVPRYIELVEDLPHTPTGRIAKAQLPYGLTGREWDAEEA